MTHDKDYHDIDELEVLSQSYRDYRAPLGFAARVSALGQDRHKKRYWQSPLWLGAGFVTAVLAVLLVLPLYMNSDGLQPQDQPGPTVAVRPKQPEVSLPDKQVANLDDAVKTELDSKNDTTETSVTAVVISDSDFDMANLSDAASWMASQEALEMPDFSDIPSPMELPDVFSGRQQSMTKHYAYRQLPQANEIKHDVKESNDETV